MSKAVFVQNPNSPYDDRPGEAYHFPRLYLKRVRQTIGDWVIFYEGRQGLLGYVAVQKVLDVVQDPLRPDHYFAVLDPSELLQFERVVPRADEDGIAFERVLRGPDGRPMSGGANTAAVRLLSDAEFDAIVRRGCTPIADPAGLPREAAQPGQPGFAEAAAPFEGPRPDVLTSRKWRDEQFARIVKRAYGGRCAISGLELRNGGGRAEVQAAHIRPVAEGGPDWVRNGLALSGTLHWMFDRGLISVAEDMRVLISHNKVPDETARRLIAPERRLRLPENPRDHPHPEYLRWHRENVFGRAA